MPNVQCSTSTFRADTFDDMAGRCDGKARRYVDLRNRDTIEAERAVTLLAEEMHVKVVVIVTSMTVTQLIAQGTGTVLDGVHQVMLAEERQGTEDARLVN